jgi:hypothetical protein
MLIYIRSSAKDIEFDNEPSIIFKDGNKEIKRLLAFSINLGWFFTYKGRRYLVEEGKIKKV